MRDVVHQLENEARRIGALVPGTRWYIFGSSVQTPDSAADVDILIICHDDASTEVVRAELAPLCASFPIHLLLLTNEEESQLGFINAQSCIALAA